MGQMQRPLDRTRIDAAKARMIKLAQKPSFLSEPHQQGIYRAGHLSNHFYLLNQPYHRDFWWKFFPKPEKIQAAKELAADYAVEFAKHFLEDKLMPGFGISDAVLRTKEAYGAERAAKVAKELRASVKPRV